jgi:hypothetical protein
MMDIDQLLKDLTDLFLQLPAIMVWLAYLMYQKATELLTRKKV